MFMIYDNVPYISVYIGNHMERFIASKGVGERVMPSNTRLTFEHRFRGHMSEWDQVGVGSECQAGARVPGCKSVCACVDQPMKHTEKSVFDQSMGVIFPNKGGKLYWVLGTFWNCRV